MKYVVALLAVLLANTVQTQGLNGFQTPSGNTHCQAQEYDSDEGPYLRCDMAIIEARIPRRPRDCEDDWGGAFALDADRAVRVCHTDTVWSDRLPVLRYGATWRGAGITCVSQQSGLTCTNRNGRGFQLSRATQRIF
jgi:hypothetical protein